MLSCTSDTRLLLIPSSTGLISVNTGVNPRQPVHVGLEDESVDPNNNNNKNQTDNASNTTRQNLLTLATAIKPQSSGTCLVLSTLTTNNGVVSTSLTLKILKDGIYCNSGSVTLPALSSPLKKSNDDGSVSRLGVRAGSVTTCVQFCTHDCDLFAVSETFFANENVDEGADSGTNPGGPRVQHRLHLLKVESEPQGQEGSDDVALSLNLLGSNNLRDNYVESDVDGVMKEAEDLMSSLNAAGGVRGDDREGVDSEVIMSDADLIASLSQSVSGGGGGGGGNNNDGPSKSRKISFSWLPATRKIITVQWGEVWYWSTKVNGNNTGLTLENQDSADSRLKGNFDLVTSSCTNVVLPPLKRVNNLRLEQQKKPKSPEDDLVVIVAGKAPGKVMRIDGSGNIVSSIECQLADEEMRNRISFTCACVCGKYVVLGGDDGGLYFIDSDTFKFVERLSIDYPASHRVKLNLRTNVLNSMKSARMNKKGAGGGVRAGVKKGEKVKKEKAMEMKRVQKSREKKKEKFCGLDGGVRSPCIWVGVTGPQITNRGRGPKIVAEYADGTVCLHSVPFSFEVKKGEEGGGGGVGEEDEGFVRVGHSVTGAVYASTFASSSHSARILKLNDNVGGAKKGGGGPGASLLFTGGADQSIHIWKISEQHQLQSHFGGVVTLPASPVAVIDVPKSVNERMSYVNFGSAEGLAVGDWLAKGGKLLAEEGLESIDVSVLPPLTVTSITVNNNGNEVAIGCANGGIKIYDLTPGNGGKCTYSCDSKVAALGVFDDPDEVLKTPPTIVTSLAFDVNVEGRGSSRNSQYLTVQHSSG
ncbi:hypothetical protein TL16_g13251, partial [Triparma laevis f. inornata]